MEKRIGFDSSLAIANSFAHYCEMQKKEKKKQKQKPRGKKRSRLKLFD